MQMRKQGRLKKGVAVVVIIAILIGCRYGINSWNNKYIPELTSYVDTFDSDTVVIEDEDVPLASGPTVTTKTTTKTTKKTVKLKKAATKTYKVTKPSTTKVTKNTTKKSNATVTVKTTKVTSIVESYTKKSKKKVVTTTVKTTVRTVTTPISKKTTTTESTEATTTTASVQNVSISDIAKKADKNVLNAYTTLGFNVTIDSSVSYSGYFNAKLRSITLRKNDDTIYHELGHFLAFVAGNVDKKSDFTTVYNEEKSKFTGINKAYATQNSSEYFAESYKNYVENPSELKKSRPKTYESIKKALDIITDAQVKKVQTTYSAVWK